ncbi:MAG: hypothetical protein JNN00_06555 [Chitinophagaceae bacterium]|nr:hypothetical protein [Chitinophagaceae bacterium]
MNSSRSSAVVSIIAAIFIFLFVYTAVSKLMNMPSFKNTLHASSLIGSRAGMMAWVVLAAEWVSALLLIYPHFRIAGFSLALLLMLSFTVYIAAMLLTASRLPCSCGGILKSLSWKQHFFLNIFLTALAYWAFTLEFRKIRSNAMIK